MGKLVIVELDHNDRKKAQQEIEGMCKKLLANPIIEEYKFEVEKGS